MVCSNTLDGVYEIGHLFRTLPHPVTTRNQNRMQCYVHIPTASLVTKLTFDYPVVDLFIIHGVCLQSTSCYACLVLKI